MEGDVARFDVSATLVFSVIRALISIILQN